MAKKKINDMSGDELAVEMIKELRATNQSVRELVKAIYTQSAAINHLANAVSEQSAEDEEPVNEGLNTKKGTITPHPGLTE